MFTTIILQASLVDDAKGYEVPIQKRIQTIISEKCHLPPSSFSLSLSLSPPPTEVLYDEQ